MTYNKAIEIIKNAQNYSMVDIREAEQVLDEMVDKAKAFDRIIERVFDYYEVYEGEITEYGFDAENFGEWVEEYITAVSHYSGGKD